MHARGGLLPSASASPEAPPHPLKRRRFAADRRSWKASPPVSGGGAPSGVGAPEGCSHRSSRTAAASFSSGAVARGVADRAPVTSARVAAENELPVTTRSQHQCLHCSPVPVAGSAEMVEPAANRAESSPRSASASSKAGAGRRPTRRGSDRATALEQFRQRYPVSVTLSRSGAAPGCRSLSPPAPYTAGDASALSGSYSQKRTALRRRKTIG